MMPSNQTIKMYGVTQKPKSTSVLEIFEVKKNRKKEKNNKNCKETNVLMAGHVQVKRKLTQKRTSSRDMDVLEIKPTRQLASR